MAKLEQKVVHAGYMLDLFHTHDCEVFMQVMLPAIKSKW